MGIGTLDGKVVLITGGTGSFGKAFVKRVLASKAKKVIVLSRDELKQYEMAQDITDPQDRLRFFLGDVRDRDRLNRAFDGVDIVVHAAALKQVTAGEYNPLEFVKTNVDGTANVIDASIDNDVAKVIFLSTDKSVSPVNTYGATKMVAERMFIAANSYSGNHNTNFSAVRYGNVIGSRGSVVPLFLRCRDNGRVYPVTDPKATRFWIKMDQAIDLVLEAIRSPGYGVVFVPKIPSSSILRLVEAIDPEGSIQVTGMRKGEKTHETLVEEGEMGWELDNYFAITSGGPPSYYALGPYRSDTNPQQLSIEALRQLIL